MRFSFGKYKGREIQDIYNSDPKYLIWLATEFLNYTASKAKEIEHIKSLVANDIKEILVKEVVLKERRKVVYEPIINIFGGSCMKKALKRGTEISQWCQSIVYSLRDGSKISLRAQEIITDMCGKGSGRRNSNAYKTTYATVFNAFQLANQVDKHNYSHDSSNHHEHQIHQSN